MSWTQTPQCWDNRGHVFNCRVTPNITFWWTLKAFWLIAILQLTVLFFRCLDVENVFHFKPCVHTNDAQGSYHFEAFKLEPECLKSPIMCMVVMLMPAWLTEMSLFPHFCVFWLLCALFLRCVDKVVLCFKSLLYTYHTLYTCCCCLYLWGEDMMNDIDIVEEK